MNKQLIRNMVIAPLMLLAVVLASSMRADANEGSGIVASQDRPGMTYRSVQIANVGRCRMACAMESQCRSWTYTHPSVGDPIGYQGWCSLKTGIPPPRFDACCISGIKPPPPAVKAGRDRPPPHVEGMARDDPPPPVVKR